MKRDIIKLPRMPFDPDANADDICSMAFTLHGELKGILPEGKNHRARLLFVLNVLARSEPQHSPERQRLSWRERITGRLKP
ncbi:MULTISPECIES: hypothetical protein [Pseudomonas]|uniref:hypothetical protein n=1 Tax=Pseudomonas TaxID=286 RepID=UPI00057C7F23|nr:MULTISPECIES: hypothetical protein [Pseudomonas]KIC79714.1 hypothetical protein RR51_25230 [Pseudomonas sp. C5pp]MDT3750476.1 hypothetical protein [Pseudomonas kurunegalensis]